MGFSHEIIRWYQQHKRDLPWRQTRDPYVIWLSEVILQQTRVDQGLPYFNRFLAHFPNVKAFADAEEGQILRLWEGLGYYSRARNMHKAANMVMANFDGVFPTGLDDLLSLKGIGEYTAAAISSFAANAPNPVIDGNVYRVLARYVGIETPINSTQGKKIFREIAEGLMDTDAPAMYNQAIMEFGALQCKPVNPHCDSCPLHLDCEAYRQGKVDLLPAKLKGKKSRDRFFFYFVLREDDRLWMRKRGGGDIWENLYEFPLLETDLRTTPEELMATGEITRLFGRDVQVLHISALHKHVLSHQNLYTRFIVLRDFVIPEDKKSDWNSFFIKDLDTLAKPKLILSFLKGYMIDEQTYI